ncbi:hypothetical protein GCM10010289_58850 [Streptomyces violascens]|nr:hypothetical protein GCM10010289_58850 [Streptomyces violascens]
MAGIEQSDGLDDPQPRRSPPRVVWVQGSPGPGRCQPASWGLADKVRVRDVVDVVNQCAEQNDILFMGRAAGLFVKFTDDCTFEGLARLDRTAR